MPTGFASLPANSTVVADFFKVFLQGPRFGPVEISGQQGLAED